MTEYGPPAALYVFGGAVQDEIEVVVLLVDVEDVVMADVDVDVDEELVEVVVTEVVDEDVDVVVDRTRVAAFTISVPTAVWEKPEPVVV